MRFLLPILVVIFLAGCQNSESSLITETLKESISLSDAIEEINTNITKEYEIFAKQKTHYDFKNVVISNDYQENLSELDSFILAVNKGHSATVQIDLVQQSMKIKLSHLNKIITYEKTITVDGVEHTVQATCDSFDKIDTAEITTYVIISNGFIDEVIPVTKNTSSSI